MQKLISTRDVYTRIVGFAYEDHEFMPHDDIDTHRKLQKIESEAMKAELKLKKIKEEEDKRIKNLPPGDSEDDFVVTNVAKKVDKPKKVEEDDEFIISKK